MYCFMDGNTKTDSNMRVPWWSFGKVVLATAVMKLVETGKLDLDKSYFKNAGTLEQVLRHESGFPDYYSSPVYHQAVNSEVEPWDYTTLIEKTNTQEMIFEAGKGWMYSNIGYFHIRQLIEQTFGSSLQEALDALIFEPLKINGVTVAEDQDQLDKVSHIRQGYKPKWLYHGLLVGTLEDACRFLHNLAKGNIISLDTLDKMRVAYKIPFDIGNRPWKEPGYALGLMTDESSGSFGHTGMGPESIIAVYHFPKQECTIAVSSETDNQGIVEFELEKLVKNV